MQSSSTAHTELGTALIPHTKEGGAKIVYGQSMLSTGSRPPPPASLIVKEATKLLIAKPGIAAAAGEGFIPLLIEDLMMEIPEVSTMAILEGFHKLRMSTEPFKCTGEIITAIKKEEIEFRGARHNLLLSARHEGYVGPDRIVPPREPQRLLSKWTADDDDCDGEEPDTDGDLPY